MNETHDWISEMKENYIPSSISFSEGFNGPKGDVGYFMNFSQDKAEAIVKKLLSEGRKITKAFGGLDGDWRENHCTIYDGIEFHQYNVYKSSQWATPILIVNFSDGTSEAFEVWDRENKP